MFLIFLLLLTHLPVYAVSEEIDNQKVDLEQVENSSGENQGDIQTKESDDIKDRQEISEEAVEGTADEKAIVEESINEELSEEKKGVVGSGLSEDDSVNTAEQNSDIDGEKTVIDEDQSMLSRSGVVLDNDGQAVEYGKWYALGNFERGLIGHDEIDSWLRFESRNRFTRLFRFQRVEGSGQFVQLGTQVRIEVNSNKDHGFANKFVYWNSTSAGLHTLGNLNTPENANQTTIFGLYSDGAGGYYIQRRQTMGSTTGWWFYHGTGNGIQVSSNTTKSSFRIINTLRITTNSSASSIAGLPTANGEQITSAPIGSVVQLQANPNPGFSFRSWEILGGGVESGSIINPFSASTQYVMGLPSETLRLRANYDRNTYTLNSAVTPSNSGSVRVGSTNVIFGSTTSVTATPNPGYRFVRWNVSGAGSSVSNATSASTTFTMGHENATATAVFARESYTLNTTVTPLNSGSVQIGSTNVTFGDSTSIAATPNPGYKFVRWNVSGAGSSVSNATSASTTFTMGTEHARVTAEFEAVHELNAKAVPQTLSLGEELSANEASQLVKDVTYNGHVLKADEYEVKIEKQANTDEVGSRTAEILVTHKASNTKVTVTVPVTVHWGNAIRIKGAGSNSRGAFVYHPSKQVILPRWGIYSRDEFVNNAEFGERFYYSIRQLRGTGSAFTVENSQVLKEISANGNSSANIFESQGREWSTAYGDIVEIKHMQASNRLTMMKEEQESSISTRDNQAYIELTKDGYKLLQFDRVETPKVSIIRGMTKGELDKEVGGYVNLRQAPNVEVVGFTTYPDTTKVGESKGTIRVQEKLTTGKYVQKDYEVVFVIEPNTLEFERVEDVNFDFGQVKQSSRKQTVNAQGKNAPKITLSDYTEGKSWQLLVSQPEGLKDGKGNKIKGATISLEDVRVIDTVHANVLTANRVELSPSEKVVAQMVNTTGKQEKGITDIQIGESRDQQLSGVRLTIPRNTVVNEGNYSASIVWELVGDPTVQGVDR